MDAYNFTKTFPSSEKYGLSSQITRAAVSILSNIAEGSSRRSKKDYNRLIEMSLGSSYGLETQLLVARAVEFAEKNSCGNLMNKIIEEQKMLSSFMNSLKY